jgi:4-hydroxybenzoate polyprenyltransferase
MSAHAHVARDEVSAASRFARMPLCVDLDGTLVLSDVLLESLLALIKRNPFNLLLMVFWAVQGRARLKAEVAARVSVNPKSLPYDREFVNWLERERNLGRQLWLCTGANNQPAASIAAYVGIFEGVMASDRTTNLAGTSKAQRLVTSFGERGFDYCGNERRDLAIWRHAHGAVVVHGSTTLEREVSRHTTVLQSFPNHVNFLRTLARALRPQQWVKNVLVLVPLLTSHQLDQLNSVIAAVVAAVAFCLCASSAYVLNDMLDLEADRAHPRKSKRPFAAGDLSLAWGFILVPTLLLAAAAIASFLPGKFTLILGLYYALTLAYSFVLKKATLIDAVTLTGLYTLRIVAGAVALGVTLSFWMLLFSVFLFLSLAFVKRFAELNVMRQQQQSRAAGRDYGVADLPSLQSLGSAAGYISVLVLALYVSSPDTEGLYSRPHMLWALCVLLLCWISRVWMKAQRGEMHDDPVVFAVRDHISQLIAAVGAITVFFAI